MLGTIIHHSSSGEQRAAQLVFPFYGNPNFHPTLKLGRKVIQQILKVKLGCQPTLELLENQIKSGDKCNKPFTVGITES